MKQSFPPLTFLIIALFFSSCANIVAPTGGEKDTEPPVVIKEIPKNEAINFSANEILIEFNEFIQILDPQNNVIISPPLNTIPRFKVKNRKLYVKLNDSLKKNTTYTIFFGESICDLNERNPIQNFTYVFSTGNIIDSLTISGSVSNMHTGNAEKGAMVLLHPVGGDSSIMINKPAYFTKCDEAGKFRLSNIHEGDYNIYALVDQNSNYVYDNSKELVAFLDSPINLTSHISNIDLRLITQYPGNISMTSFSQLNNNYFEFDLSYPVDYQLILPEREKSTYYINKAYGVPVSHFDLWIMDPIPDTITLANSDSSILIEIATKGLQNKDFKEFKQTKLKIDTLLKALDHILIKSTGPIKLSGDKSIILVKDSDTVRLAPNNSDESWKNEYVFSANLQPSTKYKLLIDTGLFVDISGQIVHGKAFEISTANPEHFGSIRVFTNDSLIANQHIIQLQNTAQPDITYEWTVNEKKSPLLFSEYITPGNYLLKTINDSNANGKWDKGSLLKNILPESILIHKKEIRIKANWETEIIIDFLPDTN